MDDNQSARDSSCVDQIWICPLLNGHLQATGGDAKGRTQYLYHPEWRIAVISTELLARNAKFSKE